MAMMAEFNLDQFRINSDIALVIVNGSFQGSWLPNRPRAVLDKSNVLAFCKNSGCKFKTWDDLKAQEMKDVCESISDEDLSSYDAFICFISSHGDEGNVIYGVDGNRVTVDDIVSQFNGKRALANKPKLFFIQNCGESSIGRRGPEATVEASQGEYPSTPIRQPIETDFLVAYSSVDGYESSYRYENGGSLFITVLTEVLNEDEHNMNLTDLLSMVIKRVAWIDSRGRKQIPCFTSTLRKPVHFVNRRRRLSNPEPL